ncbi:hypothetical protein [Streptosporangium sp. NPDC006007]|uniref:hypothetical protein n=1 Tax=Streptosporangium sp. NPDC006007 TaxID=3154575 RepID=UPI0033A0FD17
MTAPSPPQNDGARPGASAKPQPDGQPGNAPNGTPAENAGDAKNAGDAETPRNAENAENPGNAGNAGNAANAESTDDDFNEDALGQTATVINNFFAEVNAERSSFGIAGGPGTRSISGRLDQKDIERALRHFVRPPGFERARAILRERHLVVLVGSEGIGKWTSGAALLTEVRLVPDKVIVFPPNRDLDGLLSTSFKKNRVYFIHDWIEGDVATSVRRFTLDALSVKLVQAEAHLVITLNRSEVRSELGTFEIGWEPPDPLRLLEAHLGTGHPFHEETHIREHVSGLRSPRQVVEMAEQMRDGARTPEEILADLGGSTVTQWFDREPKRSEVLAVAALAFAYGMPERVFERLLVQLTGIADEVERQGAEGERRTIAEDLPQSRRLWNNGHPLIAVSAGEAGEGEPRLSFSGLHHREQVIARLYRDYGYRVQEPLRRWIRELAEDLPEVQVQVAAGLALLARRRPGEVRESFLEPWAGGSAQERLAAASTLSMMCVDDTTAAIAFGTALGWVENAGQPQAMTAALAFAGGLSIRYPADTVDWLWYLSLRGIRVSNVAQRALTLMFQAAAERDDEALTGLRLLARHLDRDLNQSMEPQLARRALQAVLRVLESDRLEHDEPLMGRLLLFQPAGAVPIGMLWAWALHNAYHRADAVRALRRTLRYLQDQEGGTAAADALGRAVWSTLPEAAAVLVRRAISRACADHPARRDSPPTRDIVLALLNAGPRRNHP